MQLPMTAAESVRDLVITLQHCEDHRCGSVVATAPPPRQTGLFMTTPIVRTIPKLLVVVAVPGGGGSGDSGDGGVCRTSIPML